MEFSNVTLLEKQPTLTFGGQLLLQLPTRILVSTQFFFEAPYSVRLLR
jgi:hypothetical protein